MNKITKFFIVAAMLHATCAFAQSTRDSVMTITLKQAIELARRQSPDIIQVRHSFRSSYWSYCYYKANYLPSLSFASSPRFNHSINAITLPDGKSQYVSQNQITTDASLSISQNIALTGGTLYLQTGLQRLDELNDNSSFYKSTPIFLAYQQSLLGFNSLKWDKKIEPIRFDAAKRNYVEMTELVAARATTKFFDLAKAQTNLDIALTNYNNADTLYIFAQGRYEIGTITENDMLQLEINKLNEETNRLNAGWAVDDCMEELRSYLGIKNAVPIKVEIEPEIPLQVIDLEKAMEYAMENSTHVLSIQQMQLESESNVARAKASAGLKADIYMQLGLAQTGIDVSTAYKNPLNQQYVELSLRLPILDWGRGKGQVEVARSRRDMVLTQIEQEQNNFEMNVTKLVKQFNLQSNRLNVASKADYTAERRNDVARRLYLLEKSTILDLNAAITEKDTAKRNYISSLYDYWHLYYMLRSITLYDFEKNIPITEDYTNLIK